MNDGRWTMGSIFRFPLSSQAQRPSPFEGGWGDDNVALVAKFLKTNSLINKTQ
jgi:hypothetical protein